MSLPDCYAEFIELTKELEAAIDLEDEETVATLLDRREELLTIAEGQLVPEPGVEALLRQALIRDARCQAILKRKMAEIEAELRSMTQASRAMTGYVDAMGVAPTSQVFELDK